MSSNTSHSYLTHTWLIKLGIGLMVVSIMSNIFLGEGLSLAESMAGLLEGPQGEGKAALIMWWVRLPRLITSIVAGATLALTGAAMQSLLRNDLADPYLLGVAAGGGLGAALSLSLGLVSLLGFWTLPCMSFLGAQLTCLSVELIARRHRSDSLHDHDGGLGSWLLTGVALNLFLSALLTLTLSLSDDRLGGIWRWLIGHTQGLSWNEVGLMTILALTGGSIIVTLRRSLHLLEAGHEVAWTLGVAVDRVRSLTMMSIALSVGAVVSFCGIIGFIGLLVPHFLRPRLIGKSHALFGLSALYGALILSICDLIAKLSPQSLPVGVITGVFGGAAFLYSQYDLNSGT